MFIKRDLDKPSQEQPALKHSKFPHRPYTSHHISTTLSNASNGRLHGSLANTKESSRLTDDTPSEIKKYQLEIMARRKNNSKCGPEQNQLEMGSGAKPTRDVVWSKTNSRCGMEQNQLEMWYGAKPTRDVVWSKTNSRCGMEQNQLELWYGAKPTRDVVWSKTNSRCGMEQNQLEMWHGAKPTRVVAWSKTNSRCGMKQNQLEIVVRGETNSGCDPEQKNERREKERRERGQEQNRLA